MLSHPWRGRRNDNQGSTIVLVIVVMSFIMVLAMLLMSVTLVNFRMKQTNLSSQKNFYTAESALDEIRTGLTEDVSLAVAEAYALTMEQYSFKNETERKQLFLSHFQDKLKEVLAWDDAVGSSRVTPGRYSLKRLSGMFRETAYNDVTKTGARLLTVDNVENTLNIEAKAVVLKNVRVSYLDSRDYMTQIQTDICLTVPDINFDEIKEMPDLLHYALVAQDHLELKEVATNKCYIKGNAYLGENETKLAQAKLYIEKGDTNQKGMLVVGGNLSLTENALVDLKEMKYFGKELLVNNSFFYTDETSVYMQDDMLLDHARVCMEGEYYGYGNQKTAKQAEGNAATEVQNQIALEPADYSSSILINGIDSSLDLSGLVTFKLCGSSYVNGKEAKVSPAGIAVNGVNQNDVELGESLSIRTNQMAYLVPSDCVAPGTKNGGVNPMPVKQYSNLLKELEDYKAANDGAELPLVDLDKTSENLSGTLRALHVNGYQVEARQMNVSNSEIGSMIYLFMTFEDTKSANAYFREYYADAGEADGNYSRLKEYLGVYAPLSTGAGIKLPAAANSYFHGNIVQNMGSETVCYLEDDLTNLPSSTAMLLETEEKKYQNSFAALNRKLIENYERLLPEERTKKVYDNLVSSMSSVDPKLYIQGGHQKVFQSATGAAVAVVVNGNYTIDASNTCHVVIASGDVTVKADFTGLIISGKTIRVESDGEIRLTADWGLAAQALVAENVDHVSARDYLINGDKYSISGSAGSRVSMSGSLNMTDFITYRNWKKQ